LAHLIKVFLEAEKVPKNSTKSVLRFPGDVGTLRAPVDRERSRGALLAMGMGGYDDLGRLKVIVPSVYSGGIGGPSGNAWWFGDESFFPIARFCRDGAWNDSERADESDENIAVEGIPDRLLDAWDFGQRSREYLNADMDKADLDNLYYGYVYEHEKKKS
jgi:hypothetical protein